MQIGMVGLGKMGANMARRLMRGGHKCAAFDLDPNKIDDLKKDGATGATEMPAFIGLLEGRNFGKLVVKVSD